jgi:Zn-dependent protease with chaperone function/Flp pilus assembly protein TadD
LPDEKQGKTVRCRNCQANFVVAPPETAALAPAVQTSSKASASSEPAADDAGMVRTAALERLLKAIARAERPGRKQEAVPFGLIAAGGGTVLAALGLFAVVIWWIFFSDAPAPARVQPTPAQAAVVDPPLPRPEFSSKQNNSDPAGRPSVPSPAEMSKLLRQEKFTLETWPAWSKRLQDWGGRETQNTRRAFEEARKFIKGQANVQGQLPRPLERDAIAWMLLGESCLRDANAQPNLLATAERASRRAVELDGKLAKAHLDLTLAILRQEFGGNEPRPDAKRLEEARDHLNQARTLAPDLPLLSARDEGNIVLRLRNYPEAERLLQQALQEQPKEAGVARMLARSIVRNPDRPEKSAAVRPLIEQFPNDGELASLYGYALAQEGNRTGAEQEFQRARKLGTDPTKHVPGAEVRKVEHRERTTFLGRVGWLVAVFSIFYGVVMLLMAGAGLMLARWTHSRHAANLIGRAPETLVAQGQVARTGQETWLNRLYGVALMVALVLFYAAFPFLFIGLVCVMMLLFVAGIFFTRSTDAADFHAGLMRASSGGIAAMFRSLVTGFSRGAFGIAKTPEECPRLYEIVEEVARRVDTEPVDDVYICPDSDIGVKQEGRGPFGLFGARRRVLILGIATLRFLTISELKAILAHEYAHFSHGDTLYNRFIAQVSLALAQAREGMRRSGGAICWINPFFWFYFLYSKAYGLLSSGFSRSREYLADRMACSLYGSDVFSSALAKVVAEGALFELVAFENVWLKVKKKRSFPNLYQTFREFRVKQVKPEERDRIARHLLEQKASLFASHPTFAERKAAADVLPRSGQVDKSNAISLFEKPDEIEKELTRFLTEEMEEAWNR